ncbi:unnamed protein product [Mytilus edulis]|uniref:Reverse transcriptase domain-containing protein n=1 Tax=Mytilus edulis TaxID=6550 RepID=A0A8S3REE0_MYTED|nr:unnamed protein product [Mytilus edulis]
MKLNLIEGFTFGFKINSLLDKKVDKFPSNNKSARENPDAVNLKLTKEIMKGRIKGPFNEAPFEKFICSPLGLIPKKENRSFHSIHDLSFPKGESVNFWTPPEYTSVSYQNIETVIELVQEHGFNCEMSKADVEDAFRLIPLHFSEYHLLGFKWEDKFYHDAALPMGASSSCQLFKNFSSALQWILNSKFQIRGVSHLLDDFFFVGEANTNKCSVALNTFLTLSKTVGAPIKDEKTQLPTTCITIYGIDIDSRAMVARLPKDKIAKILGLLNIFKVKKKLILRELQSLLGLLNFACSVPGRAFLRRFFDLTIGHSCPHYRITLNSEARADLRAWFDFISNYNGKSCFLFQKWVSSNHKNCIQMQLGFMGDMLLFLAVLGLQGNGLKICFNYTLQ